VVSPPAGTACTRAAEEERMLRRGIAGFVVGALVFVGSAASADLKTLDDPNDTQGKLDVRRVIVDHDDRDRMFKIKTFEGWDKGILEPGKSSIRVNLKIDADSYYTIEIMKESDGKLHAYVIFCKDGMCNYDQVESVIATKPNRRTLRFVIRRGMIPKIVDVLRWKVEMASGSGCDGNCYFDQAPNSGYERHSLS
jgi:hypothetical protein